MDGQTFGVRTSAMDEKCHAFETLVIYCSTLGSRFAPYLAQTLEVTLPCLRFYFHEGVREACAMYVSLSKPFFLNLKPFKSDVLFLQDYPNSPVLREAERDPDEPNGVQHLPPTRQLHKL